MIAQLTVDLVLVAADEFALGLELYGGRAEAPWLLESLSQGVGNTLVIHC